MGSIVLKAATDLPARLFGGNAQTVEVSGLDYTLHLAIDKLPIGFTANTFSGLWTVVWNETANTYQRVDLAGATGARTGPPGSPGADAPNLTNRVAELERQVRRLMRK